MNHYEYAYTIPIVLNLQIYQIVPHICNCSYYRVSLFNCWLSYNRLAFIVCFLYPLHTCTVMLELQTFLFCFQSEHIYKRGWGEMFVITTTLACLVIMPNFCTKHGERCVIFRQKRDPVIRKKQCQRVSRGGNFQRIQVFRAVNQVTMQMQSVG